MPKSTDDEILDAERRGGPYVAAVDTNVLIEFFTLVDLDRAAETGRNLGQRAAWSRETLWLSMCLDDISARTLSLTHEAQRIAEREAPPKTPAGEWPGLVAHFVKDHVCPAWDMKSSSRDEDLVGTACDRALVAMAHAHRIPIISRADDVRRFGRTAGVKVLSPREFAAEGRLSLDDARGQFFRRYDEGTLIHLAARFGSYSPFDDQNVVAGNVRMHRDALRNMRDAYAAIWDVSIVWEEHAIPSRQD